MRLCFLYSLLFSGRTVAVQYAAKAHWIWRKCSLSMSMSCVNFLKTPSQNCVSTYLSIINFETFYIHIECWLGNQIIRLYTYTYVSKHTGCFTEFDIEAERALTDAWRDDIDSDVYNLWLVLLIRCQHWVWIWYQWPFLLTWFDINPSMDK